VVIPVAVFTILYLLLKFAPVEAVPLLLTVDVNCNGLPTTAVLGPRFDATKSGCDVFETVTVIVSECVAPRLSVAVNVNEYVPAVVIPENDGVRVFPLVIVAPCPTG
jgi:hypothetical protein